MSWFNSLKLPIKMFINEGLMIYVSIPNTNRWIWTWPPEVVIYRLLCCRLNYLYNYPLVNKQKTTENQHVSWINQP
jgi:hypothetical protein